MSMDYSTIYFNKPLQLLEYQDIVNYFVETKEESTTIEFKAYSALYGNFTNNLEGVIKTICAYLNSEGGILIWGAPVGAFIEGQNVKSYQGVLSPLTEFKEKDWLINKISDSITPLPVGINVTVLQNEINYVYVFEVQPSNYSPHQYKNTYLARLDGQTKPAPHYLIEALFKKIRYPNIQGFIKLENISINGDLYNLEITIFIFNFSPLQNEENASFRLMCPQGIFSLSRDPNYNHMYSNEGHQLIYTNFKDVLYFGEPNLHSEILLINPIQLVANFNNELDLLLSFAGRFSPLKTSRYKLNFRHLDLNNTHVPTYLISEIEENILLSDKQESLGITRERTLLEFLSR